MKQIRLLTLLILAALLGSCGLSTPVKTPEVRTYTLNNITAIAARGSQTQKTLLVTLPVPNPGFATSQMIYEAVPYDLHAYATHQWAAPPAQMLLPVLAQLIRNQGYFKAVVTTPYSNMTNYRLDTHLIALQQEFLRPTSRVHLILQEALTNVDTGHIVGTKQFNVYVKSPGNNPYSGVIATNKAVQIVGKQISIWIGVAA